MAGEYMSPPADSILLRNLKTIRVCRKQLDGMGEYLALISINHHFHTIYVYTILDDTAEALMKLSVKCI